MIGISRTEAPLLGLGLGIALVATVAVLTTAAGVIRRPAPMAAVPPTVGRPRPRAAATAIESAPRRSPRERGAQIKTLLVPMARKALDTAQELYLRTSEVRAAHAHLPRA